MRFLSRLEQRFGFLAVPHLTVYLAFGQFCCLLLGLTRQDVLERIALVPLEVTANGQWWRLFTFVFFPMFPANPLFAAFALLLFVMMGNALEHYWGEFRFTLFILVGWLATAAGAFVFPYSADPVTNGFINGSIFLAFAFLNPDFTILVLFILPVKIKWLALITWAGYFWSLLFGTMPTRVAVLASIANFLLFFWRDLVENWRRGATRFRQEGRRKRMGLEPRDGRRKDDDGDGGGAREPFHVCAECGITDQSHPRMEFRYCPQCVGGVGYCMDHLHNHTHRAATPAAPAAD